MSSHLVPSTAGSASSSTDTVAGSSSLTGKRRRVDNAAAANTESDHSVEPMEAEEDDAMDPTVGCDKTRAKKTSRTELNAASSSILAPGRSLDDDLRAAQLAFRRAAHTAYVLQEMDRCRQQVSASNLCALLTQSAADGFALLDLNLPLQTEKDGERQSLFAHLVELLLHYELLCSDRRWQLVWQQLMTTLDPILPQLIQALDPRTVSSKSNTVLHLIANMRSLTWMQQLCTRLVERGFDLNAFNDAGNSPLLRSAMSGDAANILFFRSLGADCCAQSKPDGSTVLHLLAWNNGFHALQQLFADGMSGLGLLERDIDGRTPAEVAARVLAIKSDDAQRKAWPTVQLLAQQTELLLANGVPWLRRVLAAHLLPDLASIVVGYIDGSGAAHPAAAASEAKENDEE